jgi:hypothetical protein
MRQLLERTSQTPHGDNPQAAPDILAEFKATPADPKPQVIPLYDCLGCILTVLQPTHYASADTNGDATGVIILLEGSIEAR